MIRRFRWWLYRHLPTHGIYRWLRIDCACLLPKARRLKRRGNSAILFGGFANSLSSELYIRPDKSNPAREWFKDGREWERLEGEGKTKKLDDWDGRKAQIKSWQDVGYEL